MSGLYLQTVPVFIKYLKALAGILEKGAKHGAEKGVAHEDILTYRLVPDMQGLRYQVQSCSNTAKFTLQRLGSLEVPIFADDEQTFEQLQERITATIKLLEEAPKSCMDGVETKEIIMETKMGNFQFATGQIYASEFAVPNFHFHLSSAYCILRTQGVGLGAMDYFKDVFNKVG